MSLGVLLPSSNCVINLAPDKRAVLREAYRVLKVMLGPVPAAGVEGSWGGLAVGVPLGCSKWDPARQGCGMGPGEGTSAKGSKQGSVGGCLVLPTPFVLLLLGDLPSLLAAFQPGGEMYFSDVYASERLSETVQKHRVLWGA